MPQEVAEMSSQLEKNLKKVAVLQSNYIPWKGYFRIIRDTDLFIFYDDVKFTKNDWRNRNQIFINNKKTWLSIPVGNNHQRLINEVQLPKTDWKEQHLRKIYEGYRHTTNFSRVFDFIETVYFSKNFQTLSDLNKTFIKEICKQWLSIDTIFAESTDYKLSKQKSERVLELCLQCQAEAYISGPAAKTYLDTNSFINEGIKIIWAEYLNFKKYEQISKRFENQISIIDTLFHTGKDAKKYL